MIAINKKTSSTVHLLSKFFFYYYSNLCLENRFRTRAQTLPIAFMIASLTNIESLTLVRINNIRIFNYSMYCFCHTLITETQLRVQYLLASVYESFPLMNLMIIIICHEKQQIRRCKFTTDTPI
jgi:hypothetical protein